MKSLAWHSDGPKYNRQGECHPQKWPSWPSLRIAVPWRLPTKFFALWQLTYTLGTSWTRYMNFPWQNMSYKWFYPAQGTATPMFWEGLKLKLCDYREKRYTASYTTTHIDSRVLLKPRNAKGTNRRPHSFGFTRPDHGRFSRVHEALQSSPCTAHI